MIGCCRYWRGRVAKGRPRDPNRERRGTGHRPQASESRPSRSLVPIDAATGRALTPIDVYPPPAELPEAAHDVWRAAVMDLGGTGYMRESFLPVLTAYCQAVLRHAEATANINRVGLLVRGTNGPVVNPLVKVEKDMAAAILRYADALGFTPAARIRLALEEASTMSTLASLNASLDSRT